MSAHKCVISIICEDLRNVFKDWNYVFVNPEIETMNNMAVDEKHGTV